LKTAGRILAKSIAEHLGVSLERVRSIDHDDLDMRKLSVKWVPKCLNADQKRASRLRNFGILKKNSEVCPTRSSRKQ
jgi:hypothetical protein